MSPIPTCLPSEALLTQSLPLLSQGDPAQVIMGRPECLSPTWSPWPFQLCTHQHTSQYITTDHHPSSQLFSPHGSSQHSLACHISQSPPLETDLTPSLVPSANPAQHTCPLLDQVPRATASGRVRTWERQSNQGRVERNSFCLWGCWVASIRLIHAVFTN